MQSARFFSSVSLCLHIICYNFNCELSIVSIGCDLDALNLWNIFRLYIFSQLIFLEDEATVLGPKIAFVHNNTQVNDFFTACNLQVVITSVEMSNLDIVVTILIIANTLKLYIFEKIIDQESMFFILQGDRLVSELCFTSSQHDWHLEGFTLGQVHFILRVFPEITSTGSLIFKVPSLAAGSRIFHSCSNT